MNNYAFFGMAAGLPLYIIWITGIILSIIFIKNHPIPSGLFLAACSLFLINSLISNILLYTMTFDKETVIDRNTFFLIKNAINQIVNITGWILIIVSVFYGRVKK
jgi:hypothetical protein